MMPCFFPMWLILFQKDRLPFLHGSPREAFQHGGDRSHKALELAQLCFCHILLVKASRKISHNSEVGETLLLMRKAAKNLWLHLIYQVVNKQNLLSLGQGFRVHKRQGHVLNLGPMTSELVAFMLQYGHLYCKSELSSGMRGKVFCPQTWSTGHLKYLLNNIICSHCGLDITQFIVLQKYP